MMKEVLKVLVIIAVVSSSAARRQKCVKVTEICSDQCGKAEVDFKAYETSFVSLSDDVKQFLYSRGNLIENPRSFLVSGQQRQDSQNYLESYSFANMKDGLSTLSGFIQKASTLKASLLSIKFLTNKKCQQCISSTEMETALIALQTLDEQVKFTEKLISIVSKLLTGTTSEPTVTTTESTTTQSGDCVEQCEGAREEYETYKSDFASLYSKFERDIETNAFLYTSGELQKDDEDEWLPSYLQLNESSLRITTDLIDYAVNEISRLGASLNQIKSYSDQYCEPCLFDFQDDDAAYESLKSVIDSNQRVVLKMFDDFENFKSFLNNLLEIPLIASLVDAARTDKLNEVESIDRSSISNDDWQDILFKTRLLDESFEVLFTDLRTTWMYCATCIADFKEKLKEYEELSVLEEIVEFLDENVFNVL
jgi:hypothetical protein